MKVVLSRDRDGTLLMVVLEISVPSVMLLTVSIVVLRKFHKFERKHLRISLKLNEASGNRPVEKCVSKRLNGNVSWAIQTNMDIKKSEANNSKDYLQDICYSRYRRSFVKKALGTLKE